MIQLIQGYLIYIQICINQQPHLFFIFFWPASYRIPFCINIIHKSFLCVRLRAWDLKKNWFSLHNHLWWQYFLSCCFRIIKNLNETWWFANCFVNGSTYLLMYMYDTLVHTTHKSRTIMKSTEYRCICTTFSQMFNSSIQWPISQMTLHMNGFQISICSIMLLSNIYKFLYLLKLLKAYQYTKIFR